jgi:predicted RNA binding protein YcfA (HicA-like mRNA interferase family)
MNGASVKDLKTLIKQAQSQGFTVERTNGNHYRWIAPNGVFFFSATTPSDGRAIKNITSYLKVNGFIEIKQKKGRR